MDKYLSKNQLFDIAVDMADHMGNSEFLYELIRGMSRDELFGNLKHIDRYHYGNHYFSPNKTNEVSADEFQD
jgi:hypothetical protein